MNYPGLEVWKFINLAIFLVAAIFVLRRPLIAALRARRERIARELLQAKEEKEAAQRRVAEADAQLANVDADVKKIREQSIREAESERQRLALATQSELEKLNAQAQREIDLARRVSRKGLREFLAKRSVELATQSVSQRMRPEVDERLIQASIGELRRSRG